MKIEELMEIACQKNASDIHLTVGLPPVLRIDGELHPLPDFPVFTETGVKEMIFSFLTEEQKELFLANKEIDFSLAYSEKARFRVNTYVQKGTFASSLRLIPMVIKSIDELGLPSICHKFAQLKQGFIIVTGPTGHGKSTTLAAIINEINQTRKCHIVTIEDPVEFIFPQGKSIVSQRELHQDTHSWEIALRSVLREDPDVVFIGEMRDLETITAALTVAETGHLVFATLHTNSAALTIDRIIDVFPEDSKLQVRLQLSGVLEAVLSQRLIPSLKGGRVAAAEIMIGTSAVRTSIREGKTHMIDNIIQTSASMGMISFESALGKLVNEGKISLEVAQSYALRPEELYRLVKTK
ncbi:MAG: Twitching mobility protein [Microgenomates group bacterium ADurb.Bin219]|nr:MAG: Twitching mobility protein [Microgenomates group bacterium ADurb.Bin219]HNP89493.1 type IV pilus twitching motility protein PilT [Candidatus Woesebacteria bacterium]